MNEHSAFFGVLPDNAIVISNMIQRYENYRIYYIIFYQNFPAKNL